MLALPQEFIGSTCEIKSTANISLANGRIIKIDHEALEISASNNDRMPLLQYRTLVKLLIHNQKHGTHIQMGTVYLSTENFLRVEEVRTLQDFERRGAFRVNTSAVAKLTPLLNEEDQAALDEEVKNAATPQEQQALLNKNSFEVRVVDISLTGMRLHSDKALEENSNYFIEFSILDSPMSFCLRVQRLIKTPQDEIQYGCIFFDYTERQMDFLCKELFQLQRHEKNRQRNSLSAGSR